MVKIRIVSSTEVTQRIVAKLLLADPPVVGVACKTIGVSPAGPLTLVILLTYDNQVYIFDVKKNKDMIISGGLVRLLESTDLLKVFHDCRNDTAALHSQFRVNTRNVFDTQGAYSVLMEEQGLPTRIISVHDLHAKYGGTKKATPPSLALLLSQDCNFWARRPLSRDMIYLASDGVSPLITLSEKLKRDIKSMSTKTFTEVCDELIHEFCDHNTTAKKRSPRQTSPMHRSPRLQPQLNTYSPGEKPPIMSLNDVRVHILDQTIPLASPRALTWN